MSSIPHWIPKRSLLDIDDPLCPMSHILGDFISRKPLFTLNRRPWNPPTDIYETSSHIVIKMELAGIKKEEIDIILENNILSIQGHRMEPDTSEKKNYHLMEIHFGLFHRAFELPHHLANNEIQASLKEGFLHITIPKKAQQSGAVPITSEED